MVHNDADSLLAFALERLRANPYGMLVTSGDWAPNARLVEHLAVEDDGTVWVGTSPRSRKIADVRRSGGVSYAVEDRNAFGYVTVRADAELVDDPDERRRNWEEGLIAFFPEGPLGDDFVLLRLHPRCIEIVDFAGQIHPEPYGLVPAVIERAADGTWSTVPATRES